MDHRRRHRVPESRQLSGLELKWLAAHRIQPPFAIDFVAVLDGRLTIERTRHAWESVCRAHPALSLRLQGRLGRRRWVADGRPPPLVQVAHDGWDARRALPAQDLDVHFDPVRGPVALLAHVPGVGQQTVLMLRVLHAVTDGRGGLFVLRDLMRALRGESLDTVAFEAHTDAAVSKAAGGKASRALLPNRAPLARSGPRQIGATGGAWVRTTMPCPPAHVYGEVVVRLARWSGQERLRMTLPVDLRRHLHAHAESLGNLTGLVHLDVTAADSPGSIRQRLRAAVDAGEHHGPVLESATMRRWPLGLTAAAGGALSRRDQRRGQVPASATVSNLGRLSMADWRAGELGCSAVFVAPPASPGLPLLAVMTGNDDRVEVCGAVPTAWGAADQWCAALDQQAS